MNLTALANSFTTNVISAIAFLLMTGSITAFFYGTFVFLVNQQKGDSAKSNDGKQFMLWGLISLFVMFSVWGIITALQVNLGFGTSTNIQIPAMNVGQ